MKVVTLKAEPRESLGSADSRRARREGRLPVAVYADGDAAAHITVDMRTFRHALEHGARVIDLDEEGSTSRVLLKDVQFDALGMKLLHADFLRLSADKPVELAVPLELEGTPKGVQKGGTLTIQSSSVTVRCLPKAIPENLPVDVSELDWGSSLVAGDVTLPEGAELVTDPGSVLLTVMVPRGLKGQADGDGAGEDGEGGESAEAGDAGEGDAN